MKRKRHLVAELLEPRLVPSTYYLHQGTPLQPTIDLAQPGDSIFLDAGATFMGPITLRAKSNPQQLTITIATNLFPLSPGVRVGPSNASSMAQILSPGSNIQALATAPGANYYTIRGINILPVNASAVVDTLVTIGDGSSAQTTLSSLPNNIILDQCFIHAFDGQGLKRGVGLNDGAPGSKTGVYNSYVSNFKLTGQDSQAVAGWNGTGPYTIQNNYLEASGENLIFGGGYSYIQQVPSNITISGNTFSKPLSWNPNDPSYAGTSWSVKNLLELKNASSVMINDNTFQNNWVNAQAGSAILLTPRGLQSGGIWAGVSNVTIVHNILNNSAQGIVILGEDDMSPGSAVTTNITIQNNLMDVASGAAEWGVLGAAARVFSVEAGWNFQEPVNLTIDHNTILRGQVLVVADTVGAHGFVFTNNIVQQGIYGIFAGGLLGIDALNAYFPGYVFTNNVIVGGTSSTYPPGQAGFPSSWNGVGFVNYQVNDTGNYLLAPTSPFYNAGVGSNLATFGSTVSGSGQTTTTAVSSSANPSVVGQSVTFTATVTGTGPGTPTGTVTFTEGSTTLGTGTLTGGGSAPTATFTTSSLAVATHAIMVSYGGDSTFASSSGSLVQTVVNKPNTSTTVTSSANPAIQFQTVTFTATVSVQSPGAGNLTGMVQFQIDGKNVGAPMSVPAGTASYSTSSLGTGTHTVTASYSNDSNFGSSIGGLVGGQQVDNQFAYGSSTTTVTSSANPAIFGHSVTFTATVNGGFYGFPTGTVTFFDGFTNIGQSTLSSLTGTSTVTFTTSSLAGGSHLVTASYGGSSRFKGSQGTLTQTVGGGSTTATTTTVSSSPSGSVFGQSVTFTATVTGSGPGSPSGTVTFKDGSTTLGTGTLSGGAATFMTFSLAVGTHSSITANYGGDSNFAASISAAFSLTVGQANTSIAVTSSVNPSSSGQSVTFTATVTTNAPGTTAAGSPTGTVTFKDGTTTLGTGTLSGGAATFSTSLTAGNHTITATYAGDNNFLMSTSGALTQTVTTSATATPTTTTVSSSPSGSVFGQSVTFTAMVAGSGPGSPSGMVTFKDGSATLGTGALSGGVATFTTFSLAVGTHSSITANYGGDSTFAASSSAAFTLTVGQASTGITVSSSPNPSSSGQSVTFTATVTVNAPGTTAAGGPSGTVTFKDGTATLGTGTLSGGAATFSTSTLAVGTHSTITASYGGDSNFAASTSAAFTHTVSQASTSITVSSSPNPSSSGQSVTFTATVTVNAPGTTAAGGPSGTVTFKDGTATLGTGTLTSSGVSTFSASLAAGNHTITASYAGDNNFLMSSSGTLTQTVTASVTATTTAVSSSANPSIFGQMVTFTATVSSNGPGTPTGTVTFMDGSATLGTGMLSSGGTATATFSTSSLAVGTHTITATYSGDGSFGGGTGTLTGGQIVNNAGGNVTATLNPGTGVLSITGDTRNNTITITQVSPGVIQVAGTATTINQSSSAAQFNFVTGITISFLNGKDSVTINNVSLSGDISISAGSGSDTVTVKGVSCLDLTIQAHSAAGNSDTFDLENDTTTKRYGGGLVLDDSKGAGNDTVILSHLNLAYQVAVTLSSGVNTLSADHVAAVFGSINGGAGGNNHYFDNGGNSGYLVSGFVGH